MADCDEEEAEWGGGCFLDCLISVGNRNGMMLFVVCPESQLLAVTESVVWRTALQSIQSKPVDGTEMEGVSGFPHLVSFKFWQDLRKIPRCSRHQSRLQKLV